uniref:Serum response factor n=1 Tax=Geodia cydonium TaxID=6047 RepID=O62543_GEOCY|nr:serum response factor [Geodia cydonium]
MLGENRYTPNPTNPDPFAPSLSTFPDPKNHIDNDERSSVSDTRHCTRGDKPLPAPGKKTRGRVKIQMEYIQNKLRRYTTFSKRKSGMMKKAYELSTLTGTQVMLLVASETGHVYTFATPKLQPMITSEAGKALIQTCLHQPDPAPMGQGPHQGDFDVRMSSTGYEETDLGYSGLTEEDSFKNGMDMHISNAAAIQPSWTRAPSSPFLTGSCRCRSPSLSLSLGHPSCPPSPGCTPSRPSLPPRRPRALTPPLLLATPHHSSHPAHHGPTPPCRTRGAHPPRPCLLAGLSPCPRLAHCDGYGGARITWSSPPRHGPVREEPQQIPHPQYIQPTCATLAYDCVHCLKWQPTNAKNLRTLSLPAAIYFHHPSRSYMCLFLSFHLSP